MKKKTGRELLSKAVKGEEENDEEEKYEMPFAEAIEEHKRLIKVLRSGDVKLQKQEADTQEKELKKIIEESNEE